MGHHPRTAPVPNRLSARSLRQQEAVPALGLRRRCRGRAASSSGGGPAIGDAGGPGSRAADRHLLRVVNPVGAVAAERDRPVEEAEPAAMAGLAEGASAGAAGGREAHRSSWAPSAVPGSLVPWRPPSGAHGRRIAGGGVTGSSRNRRRPRQARCQPRMPRPSRRKPVDGPRGACRTVGAPVIVTIAPERGSGPVARPSAGPGARRRRHDWIRRHHRRAVLLRPV